VWDVAAFVARGSNQGEIKGLRENTALSCFFGGTPWPTVPNTIQSLGITFVSALFHREPPPNARICVFSLTLLSLQAKNLFPRRRWPTSRLTEAQHNTDILA
jgi:hypothetical protein